MTLHTFEFTGDAYDACQCDEDIKDGDVLLCVPEGVVGLAGCWPVSVTAESGKLHRALTGQLRHYLKDQDMESGLDAAIALAKEHGLTLEEELQ